MRDLGLDVVGLKIRRASAPAVSPRKRDPASRSFRSEAYTDLNYGKPVMAHLNVYVFHCSRCGEPAVSLFKERTPGSTESQDTIFPAIDHKSIRTQCSACRHTQFRDASDAAHHQLLDSELSTARERHPGVCQSGGSNDREITSCWTANTRGRIGRFVADASVQYEERSLEPWLCRRRRRRRQNKP